MGIELSSELQERLATWGSLSRWERRELGRDLRREGMSYGEIMDLIPVPRSTLSSWCRNIPLSHSQKKAIVSRTGSMRGVGRDTQWRRRVEVEQIRQDGASEIVRYVHDRMWVAGTVMYWAEGSKKGGRELALSNSDPRALRLFIAWVRRFHDPSAEFVLKINLHATNDEPAARTYWAVALGLSDPAFYKTYIKPDGTGHRTNHLPHGVCSVRMRRSADAFVRTMAWIDGLADELLPEACDSISPGR